jgi:hypothetical protein
MCGRKPRTSEEKYLIPKEELTIRWRVEVAAAFQSALIHHCKTAGMDEAEGEPLMGSLHGEKITKLMLDIAVRRAKEIDRQGHA